MKIGGLFAGYGGLEMGVQAVLGGRLAWYSEIDKGALKILTHHHPDVPNVGDITAVDWGQVEPVDVLTGGFPCQDVSHAGKRAGLRPDTRTGLWSQMAYAIDQLRPALVVAENVRGLLSAEAHSDLEPCPWCMGDGEGLSALRALGAVLGDLADLGYDAVWYGLRAADVGAPHGRFRVFVVAFPAGDAEPTRLEGLTLRGMERASVVTEGCGVAALLPTPGVAGGGKQIPQDAEWSGKAAYKPDGTKVQVVTTASDRWGDYADAIARWEHILGRPAPAPTMTSTKGNPQLAPTFVEWLMGLPPGHVTDTPGITRNEALKALGNGVVPQQAEAALRVLLDAMAVAA